MPTVEMHKSNPANQVFSWDTVRFGEPTRLSKPRRGESVHDYCARMIHHDFPQAKIEQALVRSYHRDAGGSPAPQLFETYTCEVGGIGETVMTYNCADCKELTIIEGFVYQPECPKCGKKRVSKLVERSAVQTGGK